MGTTCPSRILGGKREDGRWASSDFLLNTRAPAEAPLQSLRMPEPRSRQTVAFHPAVTRPSVTFGPFRFDWQDKTLRRDGAEVRVPPRALAVLVILLERPGRVVSKQDLLDQVWQDAHVSEASLTEAIGVLRQILGDTAAQASFIQTVHRRGYRFVAPLSLPHEPIELAAAPAAIPAPHRSPRPSPRWWLWAAALSAIAIGAVTLNRPAPQAVTRATITLPDDIAPAPGLAAHTVVDISPDGQRIVYVAGTTGSYRLYLRALDRFEAVAIAGTEGGHGAFFSPDGARIGFFRGGRVFVTTAPDGAPIDIGPAGSGLGGWWQHDELYIATGLTDGIIRLPADGGAPTSVPVSGLNPSDLRSPSLMPDGRTLLATLWQRTVRDSEVIAIDLGSGQFRRLGRGVHARPVSDRDVVYLRDGQLVRQAANDDTSARPLLDAVMTGLRGAGQFAVARSGTLVYLPDQPTRRLRRLVRISPDGRDHPLPFEDRAYQNVAVSPDGRRVATTIYSDGASELWVGQLSEGTWRQVPSSAGAIEPVWSPDSRTLYYSSTTDGQYRLLQTTADGIDPPRALGFAANVAPTAAGRDFLLAQRMSDGLGDIVRLDLTTRTSADWRATAGHEGRARLSPDGRLVAFEAGVNGRTEIMLQPLDGGATLQITTDGGAQPLWAPDGRTLTVLSRRGLTSYPIAAGQPGAPTLVREDVTLAAVAAGPDGVVAIRRLEESRPLTTIHVVVNWTSEAVRTAR